MPFAKESIEGVEEAEQSQGVDEERRLCTYRQPDILKGISH